MSILVFTHLEREILSLLAGNYIADRVKLNPEIVIGGATGNSPKTVYEIMRKRDDVRYTKAAIIFLDEYFGKTVYREYAISECHEKFEDKNKAFQKDNIYVPGGIFYDKDQVVNSEKLEEILKQSKDDYEQLGPEIRLKKTCKNKILQEISNSIRNYEDRIRDKKIALQILGLGVEGHIGFNEKLTLEDALTHLTLLAPSTIKANEADFKEGEPTEYAITQGTDTILRADELILLAFGHNKRDAVIRMLFGDVSPLNPAAYIRQHSNVRLYLDYDSLGKENIDLLKKVKDNYTIINLD